MRLEDFNSSIRQFSSFIEQLDILWGVVHPSSLPRSEEFNKTSLTIKDYTKVYEKGLSLSHYNMLLNDLSYFQFSHKTESEFSMAFYPNPRITGSPEALQMYRELQLERDEGDISEEEFADLVASFPSEIYVPRIRFEYSGSQYRKVRHPGAHFHIGMSGEDRWCSGRKLSPKSFGLLMVKYYFPREWWQRSRFSLAIDEQEREENIATCLDEKLLASLRNDGVSSYMSEYERLTFHLAALQGSAPL